MAKKVKLNLKIDKTSLREKLEIKDPIVETGETIIEKITPLKNVLNFQILKNVPDFVLFKDLPQTGTGKDQGGGGGSIIRFNDSSGQQISQYVSTIQFGSGITPTYAGGKITLTSTGGGTPGGSNTQLQYNNSGAFGGITNSTYDGHILTLSASEPGEYIQMDGDNDDTIPLKIVNTGGGGILLSVSGGTIATDYNILDDNSGQALFMGAVDFGQSGSYGWTGGANGYIDAFGQALFGDGAVTIDAGGNIGGSGIININPSGSLLLTPAIGTFASTLTTNNQMNFNGRLVEFAYFDATGGSPVDDVNYGLAADVTSSYFNGQPYFTGSSTGYFLFFDGSRWFISDVLGNTSSTVSYYNGSGNIQGTYVDNTGGGSPDAILAGTGLVKYVGGQFSITDGLNVGNIGTGDYPFGVNIYGNIVDSTNSEGSINDILTSLGSHNGNQWQSFNSLLGATVIPVANGGTGATTLLGAGIPQVVGNDRKTGLIAAQALATYTVGASDGTFRISANVKVTTATLHNFTVIVNYTDESNVARTSTLPFAVLAGTFVTAITNAGGTVPYEGIPIHIRAKAGTTIIVSTTGTFTTVVYNFEERIELL